MRALEATISADFASAEHAIRDALSRQGFGVLTEIDVAATLRTKLGVERPPLKILGAWGGLITTRPYLREALAGVLSVTDAAGCEWLTLGTPIAGGHPRHPSRPGYSTPLVPFDMGAYRRQLGI